MEDNENKALLFLEPRDKSDSSEASDDEEHDVNNIIDSLCLSAACDCSVNAAIALFWLIVGSLSILMVLFIFPDKC